MGKLVKGKWKISRRGATWLVLLVAALLVIPTGSLQAQEVKIPFYQITNNEPGNFDLITPQLFMYVYNGASSAKFRFENEGPIASSITNVFFDDGTLIGSTLSIVNGPGVIFAEGVPPNDLPGGNSAPYYFDADREFNTGATSPPPANGVEPPDEWVLLEFELVGGSLSDVLAELENETLRVGIHVQGIGGAENSESYINVPIPEPASMTLLGMGALALLRYRRKR